MIVRDRASLPDNRVRHALRLSAAMIAVVAAPPAILRLRNGCASNPVAPAFPTVSSYHVIAIANHCNFIEGSRVISPAFAASGVAKASKAAAESIDLSILFSPSRSEAVAGAFNAILQNQ